MKKVSKIRAPVRIKGYLLENTGDFSHCVSSLATLLYSKEKGLPNEKNNKNRGVIKEVHRFRIHKSGKFWVFSSLTWKSWFNLGKKTNDQIKVTLIDQSSQYQKIYEQERDDRSRVSRSLKAVGGLVGTLGVSAIGIDLSQIHAHALVTGVTSSQTVTNSYTRGNLAFLYGYYTNLDTNYVTLINVTSEQKNLKAILKVDTRTGNVYYSMIDSQTTNRLVYGRKLISSGTQTIDGWVITSIGQDLRINAVSGNFTKNNVNGTKNIRQSAVNMVSYTSKVTVNYVDEQGNKLVPSVVSSSFALSATQWITDSPTQVFSNSSYKVNVTPPTIPGYVLESLDRLH